MTSRFPTTRLRRLRESQALRRMTAEAALDTRDFVYPMFATHGRGVREPVDPMPGVNRSSPDVLAEEAAEASALGIPSVLLFGLPSHKDAVGSEAYDPEGIVQEAIRAVKRAAPELAVMTDVCLCEYTDHGHCGVVSGGRVDNDATLELLARTAVSHVEAGADVVAPSAMMDGQVGAIRRALDSAGRADTPIMGYSAKYASAFYGPFRVAADSAPGFGDRRGYQMDPANARQALHEMELDVQEGADILMVKPAMAYLDVIARARQAFAQPIAAYNVSGEYAMLKAAAAKGWLDGDAAVMELLTAIKRAGADIVITYHAKEAARALADGG